MEKKWKNNEISWEDFCKRVSTTQTTTETVVLLSQQKPDDRIEVEIELDELDLTSAESKATYKEIQEYVLEKFGLKVSKSIYFTGKEEMWYRSWGEL
jgi:broad specificity phosphatase PhoE